MQKEKYFQINDTITLIPARNFNRQIEISLEFDFDIKDIILPEELHEIKRLITQEIAPQNPFVV